MLKVTHVVHNPYENSQLCELDWSIRLDKVAGHYQTKEGQDIVIVHGLKGLYYDRFNCLPRDAHLVVDPDPVNKERLDRFMSGKSDSLMWEVLTELRYNPAFGSQMATIRDSFTNSRGELEGLRRKKPKNEDD